MIIPDLNLIVYAHQAAAPMHREAKAWWDDLLNGNETVGIPWVVACGFIRIMTHPRIMSDPMPVEVAMDHLEAWFDQPAVNAIGPGSQHLTLLRGNLVDARVGGNLTTDAHLAAIAIEFQAELHSNDSDFGRFSGLKWRNPLV